MPELRLVASNDKPVEKNNECLFCAKEIILANDHFCSQWCYEQWFELKKANMLAIVLELIVD